MTVRIGASTGTFCRGLLTELGLTLGEWYALTVPALGYWPGRSEFGSCVGRARLVL